MFNRKRLCQNPDCRELFDPISPNANCCSKRCRNRKNYLRRLANAFPQIKGNMKATRIYMILRAELDRRNCKQARVELEQKGVDFSVFPPPLSFAVGDNKSTYLIGDIGLTFIKDNIFMLNKRKPWKK